MIAIQSYNSKNTPRGKLHAVKIAEADLVYVFTLVFPTSRLVIIVDLHFGTANNLSLSDCNSKKHKIANI